MYPEALAEQPLHEQRKSFDILASVNMFRYDLDHFDRVLPETRGRVCDEELSYLSEGVDRATCTKFALKREGNDLTYYKNGRWQSYTAMLLEGKEIADLEAQADPRKQFLAEDAVNDLYHMYQMRKLRPGEQHVWSSRYRKDIENKFGEQFMRSCGRYPDREMGFLYRASCNEMGDVILESQTVDRSDDDAFAAAADAAAQNPEISMGGLVHAYDDVLAQKHGGDFHAGRRDAEIDENAWSIILAQKDLIHYFLSRLEAIAAGPLQGHALEESAKKHIYGVWAAFKKRIDGESAQYIPQYDAEGGMPVAHYAMVGLEVYNAFVEFASEGRVMIGCGGSISILHGEKDIMDASPADVFAAIFGKGKGEDSGPDGKGPLIFRCKNGHLNRRPLGKLITECKIKSCKNSVGC